MTKKEFLQSMTFLGSVYEKEYDMDTLSAWYTFFHGDTVENFKKAIMRYAATNRKPPTLSDLKKEMIELVAPSLKLSASDSWLSVQAAIRKFGSYSASEAMSTLDPITVRTVNAMGGFLTLCMSSTEDDWTRTKFFKLFEEIQGYSREAFSIPDGSRTSLERKRTELIGQVQDRKNALPSSTPSRDIISIGEILENAETSTEPL